MKTLHALGALAGRVGRARRGGRGAVARMRARRSRTRGGARTLTRGEEGPTKCSRRMKERGPTAPRCSSGKRVCSDVPTQPASLSCAQRATVGVSTAYTACTLYFALLKSRGESTANHVLSLSASVRDEEKHTLSLFFLSKGPFLLSAFRFPRIHARVSFFAASREPSQLQ